VCECVCVWLCVPVIDLSVCVGGEGGEKREKRDIKSWVCVSGGRGERMHLHVARVLHARAHGAARMYTRCIYLSIHA